MVDKIGSKRTAERMDKWVELHTNNKFLYSSLMFTNRSLLSATYGSGFRVSAELSLFLFIIIILSRLSFWLFFFFRARARQGTLVPHPISHQSHIHHTFVRNESLQHQYILFSSNRAGKKRAGRRRGKSYFGCGGVEIIC